MTIYRASITTSGFAASRLYELDEDDEQDPRAVALIEAGLLIRQPDQNIGGGASLSAPSLPPEQEPDLRLGQAYRDPDGSTNDHSRHAVPAVPGFDVT